jgi:hypothetical protein
MKTHHTSHLLASRISGRVEITPAQQRRQLIDYYYWQSWQQKWQMI